MKTIKFIPDIETLEMLVETKEYTRYRYGDGHSVYVVTSQYKDMIEYIFTKDSDLDNLNIITSLHWHRLDGPSYMEVTDGVPSLVAFSYNNVELPFDKWLDLCELSNENKVLIKLLYGSISSE